MQSYPQELLVQQQPLMFIAGLDATKPDPNTSKSTSPAIPVVALENERRSSETISPRPPPSDDRKPSLPAVVVSAENGPIGLAVDQDHSSDPYEDLKGSLRKLIGQRSGKGKIWQTPGRGDTFKMVMVDKNIRLPTRKVLPPTSTPTSQTPTPHSPLSPLTTTSPLYPDGVISPIWMRKHSDMIPSVFVLFLRLIEFPSNDSTFSSLAGSPNTSLAGTAPNSPPVTSTSTDEHQQFPFQGETRRPADIPLPDLEKRRKDAERLADEELVKIIAERRRKLVERGIKFTTVLMTGRDMLDNPSLDGRLSTIRRQSGLDSRASLFVLTPVPDEDLLEFVMSLQDALRDSALDYYGAHYKRNRRKRQRLPANPLTIPYPLTTDPSLHTRPLAAQGWAVRYDYKAAVFAEIRGEVDVARRHLQDSWTELAKMFSSTSILPPRTKRWAEAKVVADCIAVKICKLCLYKNETAASLAFFHQHLGRFGELSRGWGIGEETFEFWSWVARQYRIFAELVEMGVASGLRIPATIPSYVPLVPPTALPHTQLAPQELGSRNNPLLTLQHPGYYYYTAANCTVQRRSRFIAAVEEAEGLLEDAAGGSHVSPSPGFPNEKKVDHAAIIIELFTKAYGLFKDQRRQQLRMSLYIAYRIAVMYSEAGQHEMAMKFFERISKNYKREHWDPITWSIRDTWYKCAQRTGSVETAVRLLLQMMSPGGSHKQDDPSQLQEDLMSILTTTAPSSNVPLEIDMDAEAPLVSVAISYPREPVPVGHRAPFRMKLSASPSGQFNALSFDSIELHFSTDRPAVVIDGVANEEPMSVGDILLDDDATSGHSGSLSFKPGQSKVITGSLSSSSPTVGGINKIVFTLSRGQWRLRMNATPSFQKASASASSSKFLPTVRFAKAPPRIRMEVTGPPSAYTSERVPFTVVVANEDDIEVNSVLHLDLQGLDRGDDFMLLDGSGDADPTGQPDRPLSISPGQSKSIQCRFQALQPGIKTLRLLLSVKHDDDTPPLSRSIQVDISEPFRAESAVTYTPLQHGRLLLLALGSELEELYKAEVVTTVELGRGADIVIRKARYVPSPAPHVRLIHDTLSELSLDDAQPWQSGDAICSSASFRLALPETMEGYAPAQLDIEWNSSSDSGTSNVFHVVLPPLIIPQSADHVDAVLHFPQRVQMLHPFEVLLVVTNTHNTAAASSLVVHLASDDNFVWEGGRQTKLPLLLPGGQWTLPLSMTALQTGWQSLPSMRLADGHPDNQREIPVKSVDGGQEIHVYVQPA